MGKMELDGRFVSGFAVLAICIVLVGAGLLSTDLEIGVSDPQLASSFQGLLGSFSKAF